MSTTIFEKQGKSLTVKPAGRLDATASPVLDKELQPYLNDVLDITMDFVNVEYISSAGMRVLLATEQRMEECDGNLRLIHVNENILEVFELVGFMDIVNVEED